MAGPSGRRSSQALSQAGRTGYEWIPEVNTEESSSRFRTESSLTICTSGRAYSWECDGAWLLERRARSGRDFRYLYFRRGTPLPQGAGRFEFLLFACVFFSPRSSLLLPLPLLPQLKLDGRVGQNTLPVALLLCGCDCFLSSRNITCW